MKVNSESLKNLIPRRGDPDGNLIPYTTETARLNQQKGLASRLRNIELQNQFKITADSRILLR